VTENLLDGSSILVIENDATDSWLDRVLEDAGAIVTRADLARAIVLIERPFLSAVVMDWTPASKERRGVIRRLRERGVPFLIYSAELPASVTAGHGAPFLRRPSPPHILLGALVLLIGRAEH
jgi:DNA-binding response OmpR family regulator